jgi:hypothetical protein
LAIVRTGRPGRLWPSLLLLGGVFVALRGPSLVEPTWYSDEGTYADVGRALLHGATLYRDVWDNKPPGVYWLAAAIDAALRPSGRAFAAVLAVIVAGLAAGVWILGDRAGGRWVALGASLLCLILASLPNLEGDLFNAELVGAAFVVWAIVLLTGPGARPSPRPAAAVAAGVLVGLALLCKGVFVFDLVAVAAVPLWCARAGLLAGDDVRRRVAVLAAGAAGLLAFALLALAAHGSVGGLLNVLLHQDVNYVVRTNGPGGSVLTGATGHPVLDIVLLLVRVAVPLGIGGVLAWLWSTRGRVWPAITAGWLAADLAASMVSSREFPHYVLQAVPAASLATALLVQAAWVRRGRVPWGALAALIAVWPLLQAAMLLPRAEVAWVEHDPFPPLETDSFRAAQLPAYYRLGWQRILGRVSPARYDALFPTDLARLRATVALFDHWAGPRDRVFVWGTIHWSYALSNRLPAGRYVSLNTAYQVDPTAPRRLIAELTSQPPAVLVVDVPLTPAAAELLARLEYRRLPGAAGGDDAWVAPWAHPVAISS